MNKRTMFDENIPVETRLDMLKGASLPVKVSFLSAAGAEFNRRDANGEILKAFYENGRGLTVVSVVDNKYAVLEELTSDHVDGEPELRAYRAAYRADGNWRKSIFVRHSVEDALFQAIGEAHGDDRFADYAAKLLKED